MGERRQPSRVSSTLAAAEVLNGKLPQRLPTSPSSRSHHSTENPSYFRPLPYRVAMAPTGLRFLAGNQNQVDLETYKKSSVENNTSTSFMGSSLGQEEAHGKGDEGSHVWGKENRGRSSPHWGTSSPSWGSTSSPSWGSSSSSWSCGLGSKDEAASRG